MLNYEFPPIGGGAANAHLCLLKQYAENSDLHVDVLTSAPKPGFVTEKFSENITIYRVGLHKKSLHFWRKGEVIEWLIKAKSRYHRLLRGNDYDLVHAFFGFPTGWLCYRTSNKLPYIISLRGSDVPGEHARLKLDYKILGPAFKAIWKKAAGLVACSEGLRNRALRFLPNVEIDVIPNGVDFVQYHPAENPKKTDKLRLITVGRLSPTKRVNMLIDAIKILMSRGYKIQFTIVGGGSAEGKLKQLILKNNLDSCIEMTGRVEHEKMPQLYRDSDLYVSASMQEGMSNSMLEALACGLPIITTRCEGLDELIKGNGVIIEKADAISIVNAVIELANDSNIMERMSIAARSQAQRFSWGSIADKYLNQYERILNLTGEDKP
jgi:glycosyltransferase involved in cell wall biosynthesis